MPVVRGHGEYCDALVDAADVVVVACVGGKATFGTPEIGLAEVVRVTTPLEPFRVAVHGLHRHEPLVVVDGADDARAVEFTIHVSHPE